MDCVAYIFLHPSGWLHANNADAEINSCGEYVWKSAGYVAQEEKWN